MAGLLDFVQSPEGQGLLSAAFGGMAAARRGQPINTLGTAGVSGLMGYQNAQQAQDNQAYRKQQAEGLAAASALHKAQTEKLAREGQLVDGVVARFSQAGGTAPAAGAATPASAGGGLLGPAGAAGSAGDASGGVAGLSASELGETGIIPGGGSTGTKSGLSSLFANTGGPLGTTSPARPPAQGSAAAQAGTMPKPPAQSSSTPPGSPVGGASFPLNLNEIAALNVVGLPGSDKLFDIFKYANDGIKREAGNYYRNPTTGEMAYLPKLPEGATITSGGQIVPMPGAAATNAAYKGAETAATERAKAGMDFVTIPMPDGSTRMVRRDQAAFGLGNGGNPGGLGVSQSPANQTYAGETAKASAEQYKQILNAGMLAPGKIAKFQQLGQLLTGHDGGKLSGFGLDIAQVGNSLGLNIDKNLSNKEAAQALTNELALALRNPAGGEGMPGAMSDSDRQFLVSSIPNLTQSAEGRSKMVEIHTQVLTRQVDVARMARRWQQRYGRLDAVNPKTGLGFFDNLQQWADKNPLFAQPEPPAETRRPGSTGGW